MREGFPEVVLSEQRSEAAQKNEGGARVCMQIIGQHVQVACGRKEHGL